MQPFISYRENNETGILCYYILQKKHPHYIGIVSVGKLDTVLSSVPIAGYNLYVNFDGVLESKSFIPSYKDVLVDIELSMGRMGDWFLNNRIIPDAKKYQKFKI